MTDDDLTRLFTETAAKPADAAFVARVARHIAWQRRIAVALPAAIAVQLGILSWAAWPVVYLVSAWMVGGLQFLGAFFVTLNGVIAAAALLATGAAWLWLQERLGDA